jgi:N utilization substance protein A
MPEISFDNTQLGYIRLFEGLTGARVKDCLEAEDKIVFVVDPGEVHRAVGPHGAVIDRIKTLLKREVQVVEYSDNKEEFLRNLFYPFSPNKVEFSEKGGGLHVTVTVDPAFKARAIGTKGKNLKIVRAVLLRHTDVVSVSVG